MNDWLVFAEHVEHAVGHEKTTKDIDGGNQDGDWPRG